MTKKQAEDLGWTFDGPDNDVTAEKGRLTYIGPISFVLAVINKLESAND